MSKCQSPLRNFVRSIGAEPNFPKENILAFLGGCSLGNGEMTMIFGESWEEYVADVSKYKEVTMLLFMGLHRNVEGMVENTIEFIEGMVLSRLLMLIFNQEGEFVLDRVVLYLEATVELAVMRGLESGKEREFLSMLGRINAKERKFNEVGFILEMVFIKKIQKMLEEQSLQEFNQIIKGMLSSQKTNRLFSMQNALHFRHIAILRQDEDRIDSYFLQFVNGNKLIKMKESNSNSLPNWVQQAFWRMPKSLNLTDFRSSSAGKVFSLLSEVQVFASSPIIEEFGCFTEQQIFLSLFQQFLMGLSISSQPYQFHWVKLQKSLQTIRKNTESQNQCYLQCVAKEVSTAIENRLKCFPTKTRSNL